MPDSQSNQLKSIDGVKPAPRLSGENQQYHLDDPLTQEPLPEKTAAQPPGSGFPLVAVTLAVIVGSALMGLAVFMQLNPN
jgi:hypothetical protein